MIKLLIRVHLYLIPFMIDLSLKNCVIKLLLKILYRKYCVDTYKTQKLCDKAVDSYVLSHFVPYWFVTNNMIEKLDIAVFSDDYIVFFDLDSAFVTFFINNKGLNSIFLNNNIIILILLLNIILMMKVLIIMVQKLLIMLDL